MTTALKTATLSLAKRIAKEEAKSKREALEAHMLRDIRAVKLDAGCTSQHAFHTERKWRFDFAWPQRKVALEVDGGVHTGGRHTRGSGYTEDCEKLNAAIIFGWRVLRVTGEHVHSGQAVKWLEEVLRPRASILSALDEVEPGALAHPKEEPTRSKTYLRKVARLECIRCKREGYSQAAHINRDKGMGLKAGDNYTFPLCTPDGKAPGDPEPHGCHYLFDNYKLGDKEESAEMGLKWSRETYTRLKRAGDVPMNVPAPKA